MIVAGLLAVLLNYAVLRVRDDSVRVAVTATPVEAGQTLRAEDLAFTDVRADEALVATLLTPADVASVVGWVVTAPLPPGELLRRGDLQTPSAPAAQRAMSIPVDPEHAVAGALQAGDRVDVIEVVGRSASYLVTDAEVLAVPDEQPTGITGGLRAFSVTVAVDDATALRLAVAIRAGQVELVRSTGSAHATTERIDEDAVPSGASAGGANPGSAGTDPGLDAVDEPGGAPTRGEARSPDG
jgi:Flp pilus assembly protein CpaB